jgi:lambda repressor-like predicted transcriptional regulator
MTDRQRIRIILATADLTVAELARRIGRSRTWTTLVLYGHRPSPPARRAIARALGMRIAELWPTSKKEAA